MAKGTAHSQQEKGVAWEETGINLLFSLLPKLFISFSSPATHLCQIVGRGSAEESVGDINSAGTASREAFC